MAADAQADLVLAGRCISALVARDDSEHAEAGAMLVGEAIVSVLAFLKS